MARNYTLTHEHAAEFKAAAPFARPAWTVGHWQTAATEPYAVATIASQLLAAGWCELDASEMRAVFGADGTTGGIPIDRAFVYSEGGSRFGYIVTLTDECNLLKKAERK